MTLLVSSFLFAAEEKNVQVYTPMETSDKFKIDPKEISNIKSMDIKVLQEKIESIKNKYMIETDKPSSDENKLAITSILTLI